MKDCVMDHDYEKPEVARGEVDRWQGTALLEFGASWCGHCQAAQPAIEEALADFPNVRHVKIGDGPGRPLGRSYRVKLWPTLIVLRDGVEVDRVVRPLHAQDVRDALGKAAAR
jgi:thioredoxin 1